MVKEMPGPPIRVSCPSHGSLVLGADEMLLRVEGGVYTVYFDCPNCTDHYHKNGTQDPTIIQQFANMGFHPQDIPLEMWERRRALAVAPAITDEDLFEMHTKLKDAPSATWAPKREQL